MSNDFAGMKDVELTLIVIHKIRHNFAENTRFRKTTKYPQSCKGNKIKLISRLLERR